MPSTKIRPLEEKDFPELADLLNEGLEIDPEVWIRRFDMWWTSNPWMDESIPYGWVVENGNSGIVGFMGNIPVKYQINGKDGIAAAGTSLYVRPTVRGFTSLQLVRAFEKQKNINLLLNTTANETASVIFKKFGFTEHDVPYNNLEYWHIRDFGEIYNLYTRTSIKSDRIQLLAKIPLIPIKLASPVVRWIKDKTTFKSPPDHYECSLCMDCDESFTELWENNRKNNTTTICRDVETLRWLYFSDAIAEKRNVIRCIDTRNDKLVGYFVVDVPCTETDIKIMHLKDAYIPLFEEGIVQSLVEFSINLAKSNNAAAMAFWATDQKMDDVLKKRVMIKRKHKHAYLYNFINEDDESELKEQKHEFIPSPIDPDRGIL
ncbi:GNAT family N-acetyltransferase [Methanococcoides sp. LMO-2]|uniref:GNAT family N-acetyltransferase n=1 Tax=Methanococcoides cohabitans TaxID=3136559 RepID=A0ABU9KU52_9EURY